MACSWIGNLLRKLYLHTERENSGLIACDSLRQRQWQRGMYTHESWLAIRHGCKATSQEVEAEAEAFATLEVKAKTTASQRFTWPFGKSRSQSQLPGPSKASFMRLKPKPALASYLCLLAIYIVWFQNFSIICDTSKMKLVWSWVLQCRPQSSRNQSVR